MKAAICTKYGPPEVLEIQEVPTPSPRRHEILVRIMAAGVNSGDARIRSLRVTGFMKVIMRLVLGVSKPRQPILGNVFAGVVEGVGNRVTKFKLGDRVFGMTGFQCGTYAEYVAVNENSNVMEMPTNATFEEAAAIVFGGQTALHFLEKARICEKRDLKVLIAGATGSVGSAAIQIAKHHKADVSAICSSQGQRLVNELGVEKAFLYDRDLSTGTEKFDIIFDAHGQLDDSLRDSLLKKGGRYQSVSSGYASETIHQLQQLKELFELGKLKAVVDRTFPMAKIVDAHRYVDMGRKKGNVVLRIGG